MRATRFISRIGPLALLLALYPTAAFAQAGPPPPARPVAQSAEFAALRAKWEGMTEAQVRAAGYVANPPVCVTAASAGLPAALGAMGIHAVNEALAMPQLRSGRLDPQSPPIVLMDANRRVVGVEWEAASTTTPPAMFGQTVPLIPVGHEGPPEVRGGHYMFHAFFKPNGMVLFDSWDPDLKCPVAAQVPLQLPRTGGPAAGLAALVGLGLAGVGAALRATRRRGASA